jgi:osmotically-inducible protein OsmY
MFFLVVASAVGACGRREERAARKAAAEAPASVPAPAVVAAQHAVEEARQDLAARKQAADEAQQAVQQAEKRLDAAEHGLEAAKQAAEAGNDVAIFRAVQSRLLADESLQAAAVSAAVRDGSVTLGGRVSTAAQRDRAVALARETPGVRAVESRIEVAD